MATKAKKSSSSNGFSGGLKLLRQGIKNASSDGRYLRFSEDGAQASVYFPLSIDEGGIIPVPMHSYELQIKGDKGWINRPCSLGKNGSILEKKKGCPDCESKNATRKALKFRVWALVWNIETKQLQIMQAGRDLGERLLRKYEKLEDEFTQVKFEIQRNGTSYSVEEWLNKKMSSSIRAKIDEEIDSFDLVEELQKNIDSMNNKQGASDGLDLDDDEDEDEDEDEYEEIDEDDDDEGDEDEEDDDEGDEEEDEEYEEDDEEEDDDEEDQEPEPPARVKKKVVVSKKALKTRAVPTKPKTKPKKKVRR